MNDLKIINSVSILPEILKGKEIEMDIMVELPNKERVNLEFYSSYSLPKEIKSSMYLTKEYANQLNRGEDYTLIKRIEQINFIKENDLRESKFIQHFCLIDKEDLQARMLEEYLELSIVNLELNKTIRYNWGKKFELWCSLMNATTIEEMEIIAKKRPILKEVLEEMKRFSENKPVQAIFTKERMYRSEINYAKKEGLEQGIEQGASAKQIEIAKNLFSTDLTMKEISNVTGLSEAELITIQGNGVK